MDMTVEEVREKKASDLSVKAAAWIVDQLAGCHGLGWRGTSDLENEIYGWLIDHAIFRPVNPTLQTCHSGATAQQATKQERQ